MSEPIAICIEDLDPSESKPRHVRCVAIPGRQPGLRLSPQGAPLWRSANEAACELWVSADQQLILYRPEGAVAVSVSRAGRSLDVPFGKPVVLRDGDVARVGGRALRIHVHGLAPTVQAPSPLADSSWGPAAKIAAVMAMTAAVTGCRGIELRDRPPAVEPMPTDAAPGPATSAPPPEPDATPAPQPSEPPPIDVREAPPAPPLLPEPPPGEKK